MPVCEAMISDHSPEIFCAVETRTTKDIHDGEITFDGYSIIRSDSLSRNSGGVAIFTKSFIQFKLVADIVFGYNNILIVDITSGYWRGRLLLVYHSPNYSHTEFLNELERVLEQYCSRGNVVYVIGDFNINCHQSSQPTATNQRLKRLMSNYGLKLGVKGYTRVDERSKTMIDLFFSNSQNTKVTVSNTDTIADHKTLIVTKPGTVKEKHVKTVIDRSNYSSESMNNCILNCPQLPMLAMTNSIDDKAKYLNQILVTSANSLMYKKAVVVEYAKKWYKNNPELKLKKSLKEQAYFKFQILNTPEVWQEYTTARNQYTKLLECVRNKANTELIESLVNDPKKMWRELKRPTKSATNVMSSLKIDQRTLVDPKNIASELNRYFISSVIEISLSVPHAVFIEPPNTCSTWSEFGLVNEQAILEAINMVKSQSGISNVNVNVFRDSMRTVGRYYLSMINESLQKGYCPRLWRKTLVTPIQKVKGTNKAEELRPINNITLDDKVCQCIVRQQLRQHISSNNIISEFQSAYRESHSCETALNYVIADWNNEIEKGFVVVSVFIDLRRVFETINRDIMLCVLENYGLRSTVLSWFRTWLTDRRQQTVFNEHVSEEEEINIGIPQGTPLSCELFALYINAIVFVLRHCKIKLFADDILLWIVARIEDIDRAIRQLNEDLQHLFEFFCARKLSVNEQKTKYMIISSRQTVQPNIRLVLNGHQIERVTNYKYLGVIITDNQKLDLHHEYILKKIQKKTNYLTRNRKRYNKRAKLLMFKSLISPHTDFCSSILFLLNETQLNELQQQQNRAMRAILNRNRYASVTQMLQELDLLSVRQRISFNVLLMVHKMKKGLLPQYLTQNLSYVRDCQPYSLRSNDRFRLPTHTRTQNSLFYKGVSLYNAMLDHLLPDNNISRFKAQLKDYVKLHVRSH